MAYMIAPLAPHLGEECWSLCGRTESVFRKPVIFKVDEASLIADTITVAVQVNGKLRATLTLPAEATEQMVKETAYVEHNVKVHTAEKQIVKEIYVKNKILNIVVK